MTHNFTSALRNALASSSHLEAKLIKMTLRDGTVIGLTDWDQPITANMDGAGSLTYSPSKVTGISTFSAQINAAIDDTELTVQLDSSSFNADHVRFGFFDSAKVLIGVVSHNTAAGGNNVIYPASSSPHRVYDVGQVKIEGAAIHFELMGLEKRLEQQIGRILTPNCPWNFGSPECGITTSVSVWQATHAYGVGAEVKPTAVGASGWFRCTVAGTSSGTQPTWPSSGTVADGTVTWKFFKARTLPSVVSAVTDKRTFTATGISLITDFFGEGLLVWTGGASTGQTRRVRSDSGSGTLTLHIPMFDLPVIGDTFNVTVGCRHRKGSDCIGKHSNAEASSSKTLRFGGFDFLSPEDVTLSAPL